ncbi:hypothetical protein C8A00DRAFT_17488 [Chaetomidium leptoderma]|uniref:GST N-terminal domain-containing protein n=1 Tax=Chaetomidium leptoderma TaxID=669021 RepID=A0AAN6VGU4_9PEZI|nr:hypothetical protein C8A00DRAFT_17488 [Chaetomidium leptoderma]
MSSGEIVLFDIPTREPRRCWSLNPWKTRLVLNYKGLDYRTEWVEYPDIKARLEKHVPPNKEDTPFTIPTILLPSGSYIMDSRAIAEHLEAAHPSTPSLHLTSPILPRLEAIMPRLLPALAPMYLMLVPARLLSDASVAYWRVSRAEMVGMPLEEFEKVRSPQACWDEVAPVLREVTALLKEENGSGGAGPFFLGEEVSYADFVWAGFLLMCRCIGEEELEEVVKRSGDAEAHRALLKGLEPWTKRCAE